MRSFVLLWPGTFADRRREDQNISFKKKTGVLFFLLFRHRLIYGPAEEEEEADELLSAVVRLNNKKKEKRKPLLSIERQLTIDTSSTMRPVLPSYNPR